MVRLTSTRRRAAFAAAVSAAALAAGGLAMAGVSQGDLQSQIDSSRSAADSLKSQIAADSAQIASTDAGLHAAEVRLASIQSTLDTRESELRTAQTELLNARTRLLDLENRLQLASQALAANLVQRYEGQAPDIVTTVLQARGFQDLLERLNFLSTIGRQDASIVSSTRTARIEVKRQATLLASLEARDVTLTNEVLAQRNQVAALQGALLTRQIAEVGARAGKRSELAGLQSRLSDLEAKAAAEARATVQSGIHIDVGGMVQPPPGAPEAVAQVIAAGNAIATLPYLWGGGHGSFQANGYDCSGSVSYALAAAGLLSSPLDSTGFESWGEAGPGRWITVYANAGHAWMVVAGWRFDTVALAEGGTRWSQSMAGTGGFVVRHPAGL
jgi:cell wall-associated NlpC family hydrolase